MHILHHLMTLFSLTATGTCVNAANYYPPYPQPGGGTVSTISSLKNIGASGPIAQASVFHAPVQHYGKFSYVPPSTPMEPTATPAPFEPTAVATPAPTSTDPAAAPDPGSTHICPAGQQYCVGECISSTYECCIKTGYYCTFGFCALNQRGVLCCCGDMGSNCACVDGSGEYGAAPVTVTATAKTSTGEGDKGLNGLHTGTATANHTSGGVGVRLSKGGMVMEEVWTVVVVVMAVAGCECLA